jgi:uncharacterized protein YhaN
MKIDTIHLAAYGPFTDKVIDFSHAVSNFHILFGPNEAGKSTTLKALRHMLFGIPSRTSMNFLHGYPRLRVGGTLVRSDGERAAFIRRKGQAKTLRGPDDEAVLDDDALTRFLGGINADLFEQMFAIGHDDLIKGGEEIVSGKGSVGEALFAAGAGLIQLQHVQKDLDQACAALFKPGGSTPLINQTLKAFKAEKKEQKEVLLLAQTWQAHDRELRDTKERLGEIIKTFGKNRQRQGKLERIQEALPIIVRKKEIEDALVSYRDVPPLPDDFGDRRRDAEKELTVAQRDLQRFQVDIEKTTLKIQALQIPAVLIENAFSIESLQHDLGSFRKAQKDRPGLEGRMRTLQKQASGMLEEVGSDISDKTARGLKLPPSTVGEIQKLGKAFERLMAKRESAEERQRKLESRMAALVEQRNTMEVPIVVTALENVLQIAQEAGPIEKHAREITTVMESIEHELTLQLKRQRLWSGALSDLEELALPAGETVDRFEERYDLFQRKRELLEANKEKIKAEMDQNRADLRSIDRSQHVPTEKDLQDARRLRDRGWTLLRQRLEGRTPQFDPSQENNPVEVHASGDPAAFEKSMFRADHVVDRLRREADRVSKKELLEAEKEKLETSLADLQMTGEDLIAQKTGLVSAWQKIWQPSGIVPQSPREMRGWLAEMNSLRDKLSDLRSKRYQSKTLIAHVAELKSDLLTELEKTGVAAEKGHSLPRLMKSAQDFINFQKELAAGIASVDKAIAGLKVETEEGALAIADLEAAYLKWKSSWEKCIKRIGFRTDAGPTAVLTVIESVRDVRKKIDEADILEKRIAGIDRDSIKFSARVDELVHALAPELTAEAQDRAAELLYGRLTMARKDESKKAGLKEQLDTATADLEDAEKRIFRSKALLETLGKEANCSDANSLFEFEKRDGERKRLMMELDSLHEKLRNLSAGASIDAFIAEAAAMDTDSIGPELTALGEENKRLDAERSALEQKIGALNATLEKMDGSSKASVCAERAERLLATMESDVEKYARLKIASLLLARTVEQYREKHQGPLIARAGELFAQMTLDSFSRLRADYDEKGNPVLVGIRSGSEAPVHVTGMSDGSADQLYLALRLASLEQYLGKNEPLPFIVDDILLRFDDDRAMATLNVLADLSKKTQVLFFTHHRHLVDLAESVNSPDFIFQLHQL